MHMNERGFTIIELLLVLGITAMLFAAIVVFLNPAELLRQARDSTRISDMANLKNAVGLYLSQVDNPSLASSSAPYTTCFQTATTSDCSYAFGASYTNVAVSQGKKNDASGWLPMNFTLITSGVPIGRLPIDPVNDATHFYAYAATSTNFAYKLVAASMESAKYGTGGAHDVVSRDGGNSATAYEIGTNPGL